MDKVYLVCGLNDENYTEAWYEVHKTHEEAVVAAIKLCKENVEDEEGFDISKDLNRISCGGGDEFYVTQIFEIDLSKGNLLLVWYHAYDGVDFIIDGQTRDIKQLEDMYTKERNFQSEYAKIRYFAAILKNNLRDYHMPEKIKPREVNIENEPTVQHFHRRKKRRNLAELESEV